MNKIGDKFFQKGKAFLNCEYPVLCGAMTWVSEPNLVAAVSNAGGFGCLAGGNAPVEILDQQIDQTRSLTNKPFAVNLITIAPAYQQHLELLKKKKPEYVIFAGGLPKETEIAAMKEIGAKVMCFAPALSLAKRLVKAGADALIIEGMEAGGHIGLVTTTVLIQEILFEINEVPVFVAGGIATGKFAAHLFMMGAAGVQLGTRFACAAESKAHDEFKKKFIKAQSREAFATAQFDTKLPVVGVRALRNRGTDDFNKLQLELVKKIDAGLIQREEAQHELEKFWIGSLRKAVVDGDIEFGSLMAGQSVGLICKEESVKEIIVDIINGAEEEIQRIKSLI